MNRKIYLPVFLLGLSLILAASHVYAADTDDMGNFTRDSYINVESRDLVGAVIRDSQGDFVGILQELLIDPDGPPIAIVNHGDVEKYGESGRLTLVPLEAFGISETASGEINVVLNMTESQLESAPFFDPTKTGDRQYAADVYQHFGLQPYWTEEAPAEEAPPKIHNNQDIDLDRG